MTADIHTEVEMMNTDEATQITVEVITTTITTKTSLFCTEAGTPTSKRKHITEATTKGGSSDNVDCESKEQGEKRISNYY